MGGRDRLNDTEREQPVAPSSADRVETFAEFGHWQWSRAEGFACSPGARRALGQIRLGVTAKQLLRRLTAESRHMLLAAIRAVTLGAPALTLELVDRSSPAVPRTLAVMVESIDAPTSSIGGLIRDVTAITQLTEALARSESRWEMALESARQGVWDSDIETGIVYHSRTWRTMRGLPGDGALDDAHDNWVERLHPDDRDRILADIGQQHSGDQPRVAMEYRERLANGEYIWISSLGAPVEWFPDGRAKRIIGTDTDITARKEVEDKLTHLSRRLELALQVTKIGVFELDLTNGHFFWDDRIREIYGKAPGEPFHPSEWGEALHPEDRDAVIAGFYAANERDEGFRGQFRIVRRDGETRTIRAESLTFRDSQGVPRVLGTNWDVTDEVNARHELQRAKDLAEARNLALEDAKARIEHNALHDMLTDLPNRRYLDRVLRELCAEAARENAGVGVLHIDLDRFKQINDTLGHGAGDAMLVHAADLLKRNLGPEEFVARIGGDEFVVVCPVGASTARLGELASAIVKQMRAPVPYHGHWCRFGASIGIASQHGLMTDASRLLIDADIALYRAKARGKNGFEFFTETLQRETVRTKQLADDILRGLEEDEFEPYYQPLFDAQSLEIVGVEALARWHHPTEGILAPGSFLPVAEDLNVVSAIDEIILRKSLADYRNWCREALPLHSVSVNVSFRRLLDETLAASLAKLDIPPNVISFELLESIFLDDVDALVGWNIDAIRDLGIGLSIDDFGTGHASILSLVRLRPDRLKIDRRFLDDIVASQSQRRLLRSLVDIGKSLDIRVVAEGVESMEQAHVLGELGCDILQGFALARPMPNHDLVRLLQSRAA